MARTDTVRIESEHYPDDGLVINEADFDPEVHTRWGEGGPGGDGSDGSDGSDDGMPEGYRTEHAGGSYVRLVDPDGEVVPGPANGKWQGKAAAAEAAHVDAAERAAADAADTGSED